MIYAALGLFGKGYANYFVASTVKVSQANEVTDYSVTAAGERIGKVDGFLVDADTRALRYLIADTGKWLSHPRVVLPPALREEISWSDHAVAVSASKKAIEAAPAYDGRGPLTREYEQQYYQHFGKPPHWQ